MRGVGGEAGAGRQGCITKGFVFRAMDIGLLGHREPLKNLEQRSSISRFALY